MIKKKSMVTDFTQGNVPKQLVNFAFPLLLSSLLQVVYNMVDMIIVGQAMGKVGISAVSVGGDITGFLTFFIMGYTGAGQVIISQYIGKNQRDRVGVCISTMFSFIALCAVVVSIVCLLLREPLLSLMNTPAEAWSETLAYTGVSITGLIFICGYNAVSAVLRGMGDSKHPFIFIAVASVLNILLDLLFVIQLGMGAMGAALATVISQAVSFISCVIFLYQNRKRFDFHIKPKDFFRWDKAMLIKLSKLGVPMAIKSASIQFSKLFVNSWINSYGVVVSAFSGIANKVSNICNIVSNSTGTAGSSMIGQNIGAEKYERVSKIMRTVFCITLGIAVILSIAIIAFPKHIFGIFTDEAEVLDLALEFLPIAVMSFMSSAGRSTMNALINGSGNYRINLITAILDGFVLRIGLSVLFGLVLNMRYMGFWLGDVFASFTPIWIGILFYYSGKWKHSKIATE
ncbi:MAG: MATE family efflux transporter [Clostridiales bacterium]|nr:MATE family efflux transporter [Clostridiales bacterium]